MAHLFRVNQEFKDSKVFDDLVSQYVKKTKYTFGRNDSKLMKTHCENNNKNVDDYPNLKYYYRYMRCSRGGTYIPKKKEGAKSRNTKSKKIHCPVVLHVTANLKKKVLVIKKWVSQHNHPPENDDDNVKRSDGHSEDTARNDENSDDEFETAHNKKKSSKSSVVYTQAKKRYELTPKNVGNSSESQLLVSEIVKRIKKSVDYDEKTIPMKKNMLLNLLEEFEQLDNLPHSSDESDEESAHLKLVPSANQSPLHLPISPSNSSSHEQLLSLNNSPVHLDLSLSTESPQHSPSYRNMSPSHLQRSNSQEKSQKNSHNAVPCSLKKKPIPKPSNDDRELSTANNKIIVEKIKSRGRPKRQQRPAIGADYLTYGIKKTKKT